MAETYRPTQGMAEEAKKGLEWRREYGRGGTRIGVTRANQLAKRENLTEETVKRMASFFARHEGNKDAEGFRPGEKGFPSAGRIAWALWGGDAGQTWANAIVERIEKKELSNMNETKSFSREADLKIFEVTRSNEAVTHARDLIRAGKVKESASWEGPSATAENTVIDGQGWGEFGKFYLGRNSEAGEDTKAHYRYPFTDDFETVSINGLRAIRVRSAQNDETEIFESAGKLLDEAKAKIEAAAIDSAGMVSFSVQCLKEAVGSVNKDKGTMEGVSIISAGEAKGHRMMISQKTLESSITLLLGKSLPAYLSHDNAFGDRLLTEAGLFSGFYRDGEQIRAKKFTALESFKKYEPEKYDRLFEMAAKAPLNFGVSIVFEGQLFWELRDGGEAPVETLSEPPENARFGIPTVRPLAITSADFVDSPAANPSLFREPVDNGHEGEMKSDTETSNAEVINEDAPKVHASLESESASAQYEKQKAAEGEPAPEPAQPAEQPAPKKRTKKKLEHEPGHEQTPGDREDEREGEEDEIARREEEDLDEYDEEMDRMRAVIGELNTEMEKAMAHVVELMEMHRMSVEKLSAKLSKDPDEEADEDAEPEANEETEALKARVAELEKLHAGAEALEVEAEGEDVAENAEEARAKLLNEHLSQNPQDTRATAVLAVAKVRPDLFN